LVEYWQGKARLSVLWQRCEKQGRGFVGAAKDKFGTAKE